MAEYPLRWSPQAKADMVRLHVFLEEENPAAAWRAMETLRKAALMLQSHPHAGRRCNAASECRQLIIPFAKTAYIMRYRVDAAQYVVILRVWNAREEQSDAI